MDTLLTRWPGSGRTPWISSDALKPRSRPADRHQRRGRLARLKEQPDDDDTDRLIWLFNGEQMRGTWDDRELRRGGTGDGSVGECNSEHTAQRPHNDSGAR